MGTHLMLPKSSLPSWSSSAETSSSFPFLMILDLQGQHHRSLCSSHPPAPQWGSLCQGPSQASPLQALMGAKTIPVVCTLEQLLPPMGLCPNSLWGCCWCKHRVSKRKAPKHFWEWTQLLCTILHFSHLQVGKLRQRERIRPPLPHGTRSTSAAGICPEVSVSPH